MDYRLNRKPPKGERWVGRYASKPGPKKPHRGQFKKGPDPRRNNLQQWRYQQMREIEQACKLQADEAMKVLADLLQSDDEKTRLAAAREILDRGYGRPVDRQAVLNMSANGQTLDSNPVDMKTSDILRIIQAESGGETGQVLEMQRDFGDQGE